MCHFSGYFGTGIGGWRRVIKLLCPETSKRTGHLPWRHIRKYHRRGTISQCILPAKHKILRRQFHIRSIRFSSQCVFRGVRLLSQFTEIQTHPRQLYHTPWYSIPAWRTHHRHYPRARHVFRWRCGCRIQLYQSQRVLKSPTHFHGCW